MTNSIWTQRKEGRVEIPPLGLGTYQIPENKIEEVVAKAIQIGYRHFDTADFYKNLGPLGRALKKAIRIGQVKREDLFVTTKIWPTFYGSHRLHLSVNKMLQEFGLKYFDLILLHWPTVFEDSDTEFFPLKPGTGEISVGKRDIVDVYLELETIQRDGLARSIGLSNFNEQQIERVLKPATVYPVVNQVECHLYLAQFELQEFCAKHEIKLTAYCPLGNKKNLLNDETLKNIAAKYKKSPAQIAIRWLLHRGIIAIPKSANSERLFENFNVFDFEISNADRKILDSLDRGEEGRSVKFSHHGIERHPEYPFRKFDPIS